MNRKFTITLITLAIAFCVLLVLGIFAERQTQSAPKPSSPRIKTHAKEDSDSTAKPSASILASHPEPRISPLSQALKHAEGGHPMTYGDLEKIMKSTGRVLTGASPDLPLTDGNAILKLQIVNPETGKVITPRGDWIFGIKALSIPKSEMESLAEIGREGNAGFSVREGNSLVFYCLIAKNTRAERYSNFSCLIRPGERYSLYGAGGKKRWGDFYSEFTIPKDIEPGTCITFNIPAGVGVHPSRRPKKRMQIQLDPEAKPPMKADKWMAFYHRYIDYDRSTFNSYPLQGEFDKKSRMVDLGHRKLGEALTVTNPDRSVTWMYVQKADGFNIQLPQEADFVLEDAGKLRQASVTIPALLGRDGREPRHLVVGIMDSETFIPVTRTALSERFRPRGAIESERRLLSEVKVRWLPGTYHVVVKGSPFGGMSDEEMNNLTLEQRVEMFRIPPRLLTLATGKLHIPENPRGKPVSIEQLELVDIERYMKPARTGRDEQATPK